MAANLIESIQKNLGYPPLQKVDPNIHETKDASRSTEEKLAQAAIPAVLTGLYKFSRTDKGCDILLAGKFNRSLLYTIFEDTKTEAVDKVAKYAGVSADAAETEMKRIADEALKTSKEKSGDPLTKEKLRGYLSNQRHIILIYLPAAMQLGKILEDDSIDDRTHKMEGPVSSFLHKIEDTLSKGDDSKYP